jgi:ferritin-like metal-binding protein YciE
MTTATRTKKENKEKASNEALSQQGAELLYQALETELGGVHVYEAAIRCAKNSELKKEWKKYLSQTERHVEIVRGVFDALGLDADAASPGRAIVKAKGEALVEAMEQALASAPQAAEIVAAECVVDAETKDHANWQLIGAVAEISSGEVQKVLSKAFDEVEDEEDEHLYHTKGWCRELWLDSLGLEAELPPPEEEKDVRSAAAEAKAEQTRKKELARAAHSNRRRNGTTSARKRR